MRVWPPNMLPWPQRMLSSLRHAGMTGFVTSEIYKLQRLISCFARQSDTFFCQILSFRVKTRRISLIKIENGWCVLDNYQLWKIYKSFPRYLNNVNRTCYHYINYFYCKYVIYRYFNYGLNYIPTFYKIWRFKTIY